MKIRMGFVSNSSSTSFCVIGVPIREEDIYSGKFKWEHGITMIGGWNDDGTLVFPLSEDMYKILVNHIETPACSGHVSFIRNSDFYEGGEPLRPVKKGSKVYCGTCSINEPHINEFGSTYLKGEGINF